MTTEKLVLIDGHALAYRMFFALPLEAFTTKSGEPTNATYGFTRTLLDLIQAPEPPEYLAVSFDTGATFRDEMFAAYKGTREKMPDELSVQIERIKEVVRALNIPILELESYEADDVLGTVAAQMRDQVPVHIITGDRDLLQLVDDNTRVELPARRAGAGGEVYDAAGVMDYLGVRPDQVVDYKALVGDVSDNIPGVKGIGDKTAVKLLAEYGSLANLYAHLDEIKGALNRKLEDGRASAELSYKLAQIVTNAPITIDLKECLTQDFDAATVLAIFRELEFRSLAKSLTANLEEDDIPEPAADGAAWQSTEVVVVRDEDALQNMVRQLEAAEWISFDLETDSLERLSAGIVGICLAVRPPTAYYIPVGHLSGAAQANSGQMNLFAGTAELAAGQLPIERVLEAIRPAMTDPNIPKVAHNAKFDCMILERYGIAVSPVRFDTMIAEWLTDPATKHKGLKDLARHRLGAEMTEILDLIGRGKAQVTFAEVPIDVAAPYGAADADMTLRLVPLLQQELREKGLLELLDMEMKLLPVIADMERAGVRIDVDFFHHMSHDMSAALLKLEETIYEIAGEPFNINSTQQLSDILFKKLNLPREGLKKIASGHYSTAFNVLEGLKASDTTGIIDAIIEYRELGKLKGTYVDALPQMINPATGRIHTSFSQTGAITGRLASSNPNLQNIPIRSELGQRLRRGFITEPGWSFLSVDYSQVELRILAHITQDETLLRTFREDKDIHAATAAAIYDIPIENVTKNQRRFAKTINFGLIYGMGAFRLARETGLTLGEAEDYMIKYFGQFPGIDRYLEETRRKARTDGYVETLLGRRRYFPVFKSTMSGSNRQATQRAEREAVNHPIQGTAADIIKLAMIRLHDELKARYRARLLLQVHDELLLEAPLEELADVRELVIDVMSNAFKLDVPLKVEAETGANWLELKE
ncbi:MAG: DNA polymerase I [Candidatus Promineofilum sp.]|uniref:DNA polymerase I n=1 Tax=Promineifilum sp. TaxID=2664178 RepID=UPI00241208AF|nr:DNA polymerase I [Promineifilum sp.]